MLPYLDENLVVTGKLPMEPNDFEIIRIVPTRKSTPATLQECTIKCLILIRYVCEGQNEPELKRHCQAQKGF